MGMQEESVSLELQSEAVASREVMHALCKKKTTTINYQRQKHDRTALPHTPPQRGRRTPSARHARAPRVDLHAGLGVRVALGHVLGQAPRGSPL